MRIEHDEEGVSVYFEDGTGAKGDILVGADGVKSIGKSSARERCPVWVVVI